MGFVGCMLVMVMLMLIVARCIYVGTRSPDFLRKTLCFGVAAALVFQILINVGMCIGLLPIIGLTLPFISYGGSSIVSLYAMVGLVSGVHARPQRPVHERYIQPPLGMEKLLVLFLCLGSIWGLCFVSVRCIEETLEVLLSDAREPLGLCKLSNMAVGVGDGPRP